MLLACVVACKSREQRARETIEQAMEMGAPSRPTPVPDPPRANRQGDPRDREDRVSIEYRGQPAPLRPYRIGVAIADSNTILFSRDEAQKTHLVIADIGSTDGREIALAEAPSTQFLTPVALDEKFAYFTRALEPTPAGERPSSFERIPRTGGATERLGAGARDGVLAGDWIYWSNGGGQAKDSPPSEVLGLDRRTGKTMRLRGPVPETVMGMAVVGSQLYLSVQEQPQRSLDLRPGHLLAYPLDAKGAATPKASELATFTSDRSLDLAAIGDTLYYLTEGRPPRFADGTLRRWDPVAGRGEVVASGLETPGHLGSNGTHLCFALLRGYTDREIDCLRLADHRLVRIRSAPETIPYSPVIAGALLVWSEGDRTVVAPLDDRVPPIPTKLSHPR